MFWSIQRKYNVAVENQKSESVGFTDSNVSTMTPSLISNTLYPCDLSEDANECLKDLSKKLVDSWGFNHLLLLSWRSALLLQRKSSYNGSTNSVFAYRY